MVMSPASSSATRATVAGLLLCLVCLPPQLTVLPMTTTVSGSGWGAMAEGYPSRVSYVEYAYASGSSGSPVNAVGTASQVQLPHGCAVSNNMSDMFVMDTDNNVIRKVDLATRGMTTVAGDGNAAYRDDKLLDSSFRLPSTGLMDASSNLLVVDSENHCVRKVDFAGDAVTQYIGRCDNKGFRDGNFNTAEFDIPYSLVLGESASQFFLCDKATVRLLNAASETTTFYSGSKTGDEGMVNDPDPTTVRYKGVRGMAYNKWVPGTLLVGDAENMLIRFVASGGGAEAFAGQQGTSGETDGIGPSATVAEVASIVFVTPLMFFFVQAQNKVRQGSVPGGMIWTQIGSGSGGTWSSGTPSSARMENVRALCFNPGASELYVWGDGAGSIISFETTTLTPSNSRTGASSTAVVSLSQTASRSAETQSRSRSQQTWSPSASGSSSAVRSASGTVSRSRAATITGMTPTSSSSSTATAGLTISLSISASRPVSVSASRSAKTHTTSTSTSAQLTTTVSSQKSQTATLVPPRTRTVSASAGTRTATSVHTTSISRTRSVPQLRTSTPTLNQTRTLRLSGTRSQPPSSSRTLRSTASHTLLLPRTATGTKHRTATATYDPPATTSLTLSSSPSRPTSPSPVRTPTSTWQRTATTTLPRTLSRAKTPSSTHQRTASVRPSLSRTELPPLADPEPVVPVQVVETAQAAATSTAVAGSLASPGAAVQVARVVGVMGIARRCKGGAEAAPGFVREQPEFPQSLVPSLGLGKTDGQYFRGAIVANAAILVGCVVLGASGGVAVTRVRRQRTEIVKGGLAAARMPGMAAVVLSVGIDGTMMSAAALLLKDGSTEASDVVLAALGLLLIAALVAGIAWCVHRVRAHAARTSSDEAADALLNTNNVCVTRVLAPIAYQPLQLEREAAAGSSTDHTTGPAKATRVPLHPVARWFMFGTFTWHARGGPASQDDDELTMFGIVMRRYRGPLPPGLQLAPPRAGFWASAPGRALSRLDALFARVCPWFLLIDVALTAMVAIAQALTVVSCTNAARLAIAANVAGVVSAAALRPYSVPAKNVLLVAMNGLMFLASAVTMAAMQEKRRARADQLIDAGGRMAAAAAMLGFISVGLGFARIAWVLVVARARVVPVDVKTAPTVVSRGGRRAAMEGDPPAHDGLQDVSMGLLHHSNDDSAAAVVPDDDGGEAIVLPIRGGGAASSTPSVDVSATTKDGGSDAHSAHGEAAEGNKTAPVGKDTSDHASPQLQRSASIAPVERAAGFDDDADDDEMAGQPRGGNRRTRGRSMVRPAPPAQPDAPLVSETQLELGETVLRQRDAVTAALGQRVAVSNLLASHTANDGQTDDAVDPDAGIIDDDDAALLLAFNDGGDVDGTTAVGAHGLAVDDALAELMLAVDVDARAARTRSGGRPGDSGGPAARRAPVVEIDDLDLL